MLGQFIMQRIVHWLHVKITFTVYSERHRLWKRAISLIGDMQTEV